MIPIELATKVLAEALRRGGDWAEIYIEDRQSLNLALDDSKLETAVRGGDRGGGVRVFYGNTAAYAYTDDLSAAPLLNAARSAAAAAKGSSEPRVALDLTRRVSPLDFPMDKPFEELTEADKAETLRQMDQAARRYDARVNQVQASYGQLRRRVWLYNSDGFWVQDERNIIEARVAVTARQNGIIQRAATGFGGQMGLELFDANDPIATAVDVAESAVKMLDARPAPAGEMTVVITNGWGGVLFHEACGHAMEADFVTKGTSAYTGLQGQQVANPIITAIDDGTIPGRRGSLRFDDEGTPSSRTVLIKDGILQEYMWDLTEARRVGHESTGNGRRQSFRHMPMPRMTNTYIDAGPHAPEEIIRSVKQGLFVKRLGGGQADIAKGDFVFSVTEGYLIEDGVLTAPVRGATLIGNGPAVLKQIDMVGTDLALDPGMGMWGKSQWARVSLGQPTIRIPRLTVGGTDREISGQMGI
jgi:TldD protein